MTDARFKIIEGKDGMFYPRLQGGNNEILWGAEGFTRRTDAFKSIDLLIYTIKESRYKFFVEEEDAPQNETGEAPVQADLQNVDSNHEDCITYVRTNG